MIYPDRAVAKWFGKDRKKDDLFLQAWREAPLTYVPRPEIVPGWNMDHYEVVLGRDMSGELFDRAASLTLHNRFYPTDVMTAVSDSSLENRQVQAGDRVLQRIMVYQIGKLPLLEVLTLNEITDVIQEPRRAGFTYTTTAAHSEIGEWSPVVEWRDNGEVILIIDVVSTVRPGTSAFGRRLARKMQLRAHKRSIQSFKALLAGRQVPAPSRRASVPADLLPVVMLAAALLLLMWSFLGYFNKSQE